MHIYLLRHGIAEDHLPASGRDSDRQLTKEGWKKMREEAKGMRRLEIEFDLIFASPYLRTMQTAEAVAEGLDIDARKLIPITGLAAGQLFAEPPYNRSQGLIDIGAHKFSRALIVGHMPDLSELTSLFVTGGLESRFEFRKGALALVEVSDLPPRSRGVLRWFLTPRQLCSLAA